MTYYNDTLFVWDSQLDPDVTINTNVYKWNGYIENDGVHSIPLYIELNSKRLRQKYLTFVHDLGESKINNKRLIEHLKLEGDFSYWWMTLFVEKSVYKSPITDVIRMLALEEIVNKNKPNKIKLVSGNKILNKTLNEFCNNLGISYELKKVSRKKLPILNYSNFRNLFPSTIFTIISFFRYIFFRWPLRGQKIAWPKRDNSVFFCSQFSNINPTSFSSGKFTSDLWGGLPDLLNAKNIHLNWLHFLVSPNSGPKAKKAARLLKLFNKNGKGNEAHSFLEENISVRIILRVLQRWVGLYLVSWKLRGIANQFYPRSSKLSLWPILKKDWKSSIYGQVAINNLFWFELFDTFLSKVNTQSVGFYLCENQAWERSFVHLWKKYAHGKLIAVSHSTVRFWDLRHHSDIRTLKQTGAYTIPKADSIALNGKAAIEGYISAGFPKELIVESEALRFEYLYKLNFKNKVQKNNESVIKILILGDYMKLATIEMLQLLEKATQYINVNTIFTVKPHPNFIVKKEDFPLLRLEVITSPLEEILHKYDIAISSNMTSAAVDAFFVGLPSIVILDSMGLNLSPLRGQAKINFVSTSEELAKLIQSGNNGIDSISPSKDFFFLDPTLPRWQKIIRSKYKNL